MATKKPPAAAKTAAKPAAAPAPTPGPDIDAQDGDAQKYEQPQAQADTQPLTRLELAQALPLLEGVDPLEPVAEGIQSFKDADRRTMNVVCVRGELFKQAA